MIVYTTACYALGKMMGQLEASKLVNAMFAGHPETLGRYEPIDCVKTFQALRVAVGEDLPIKVYLDTAGSHVGRVRARAFHFARQEKCTAWITCDDDMVVSPAALRVMMHALESKVPTVCAVPYALRWNQELVPKPVPSVTGVRVDTDVTKDLPVPAHYAVIDTSGFGCVGVNRAALEVIAEANRHLSYRDVDGEVKLAVTSDLVVPGGTVLLADGEPPMGEWYPDDTAFFKRIPEGVRKLAVLIGESVHSGHKFDIFGWGEELRNAN